MSDEYQEILLIEDTVEDAELAIDSLREGGISSPIRHLSDGQEALDYLFDPAVPETALPRLILLDLKLPKIDGMEILQRLKTSEKHKHIPTVVLTSSREDTDVDKAYGFGANSYIVKPVDFEGFSEAVKQVGLYWILLNTTTNT